MKRASLASILACLTLVPCQSLRGGDCRPHPVHHRAAVVVKAKDVVEVVAVKEIYVAAIQLAIPQYSLGIAGYGAGYAPPAYGAGYVTPSVAPPPVATGAAGYAHAQAAPGGQDELARLRARIAELEAGGNGQRAAVDLGPRVTQTLSQRCAACHSQQAAQGQGGGFVLLRGTALADLTMDQVSKMQARINLPASSPRHMPRGRASLSQAEKELFAEWVDQLEVTPAANGQSNGNGGQPTNGQPTNGK